MGDNEERELSEEVDAIAAMVMKEQDGLYIDIPGKVSRFQKCYEIIKEITDGEDVKVSCEKDECLMTLGFISIVGKEVIIRETVLFQTVLNNASAFEVYPKTDGTVAINISFSGLSRKVGR